MSFEKSVFINCPFDPDYEPILQAIAFTIIVLGLNVRFALEDADNSRFRLDKIIECISSSKFSIHDISLCKTKLSDFLDESTGRYLDKSDYWRLNMPFELGLDLGAKQFSQNTSKRILVLEDEAYDSKRTLSDISGWDIAAHGQQYDLAMKKVLAWLIKVSGCNEISPSILIGKYGSFQEWRYEKMLDEGFSESDIIEYSTERTVSQMNIWKNIGEPDSYN